VCKCAKPLPSSNLNPCNAFLQVRKYLPIVFALSSTCRDIPNKTSLLQLKVKSIIAINIIKQYQWVEWNGAQWNGQGFIYWGVRG
jgi:hypothetical protein